MIESSALALAKNLIRRRSITPKDEGCQGVIIEYLRRLGFTIEPMIFKDTTNLWARRGLKAPLFTFAGHTDVVPVGDEARWLTPPFEPTVIDGYLYGRGAADMKGSLACMVVGVERFLARNPKHEGSIGFLITSDEEGEFINGTTRVVDTLQARGELIDLCVVGEPSSCQQVGDVIKNGRRGSLTGNLVIEGVQGHVAYPHLAKNPVHQSLKSITELVEKKWDHGNSYFPPTSFQIPSIHAGDGSSNVIPGKLNVQFNFRFSNELTVDEIKTRVHSVLDTHRLDYGLKWTTSGLPFLTDRGQFLNSVINAVVRVSHKVPKLMTTGGTSDGRFIAQMGAKVVELGPVNSTIHKVNECVRIADLEKLTDMYEAILEDVLT